MTPSKSLRERYDQHKPKNTISKDEDKAIARASLKTIDYIRERFPETFSPNNENNIIYDLTYEKSISIKDMIAFIARNGTRKIEDFDHSYDDKSIQPDGGVIYLVKLELLESSNDPEGVNVNILERYPLVIAEVKHQGTNDSRIKEQQPMQAFGNAIERLGKNLAGIKAMMHYEDITPFICFGDGCDFAKPNEIPKIIKGCKDNDNYDVEVVTNKFISGTSTVRAKIFTLNEFYELNKVMVFKKDRNQDKGPFSPVSMMFRYEPWTESEMYHYMKEIAETSFRYYMM